jgi:hypothetical protein
MDAGNGCGPRAYWCTGRILAHSRTSMPLHARESKDLRAAGMARQAFSASAKAQSM